MCIRDSRSPALSTASPGRTTGLRSARSSTRTLRGVYALGAPRAEGSACGGPTQSSTGPPRRKRSR
eukprot:5978788-Alexandrium_andersonii.AAC.1